MEKDFKVELGFVQRRLPWIVAAGALTLYLMTLSHSATFTGLAKLAQVAGWDWRPVLVAPLHFVLTYPIRWLPPGMQLVALNFLSALFASVALALLARSVALLPHDRTRDQRHLERSDYSLLSLRAAWVPPVVAVLVCGLQLSFWENAVVAAGESLDLLIFAWLVHALLQYRLDQNECRLSWFAFIYGLSVTNNFAMIAFFPAFLVALVWIKEASFFKARLILKMIGLGLAGLLLYLLLPAINAIRDPQGYTFWQLLTSYWSFQKSQLLGFPRYLLLLLSFTSILPVLFMGIRWPASFGDISPVGNALTALMTHVIHGLFLVACVYVAFDPQFSPRNLGGGRFVLLPFYFLGALSIGYCLGYFLLVFGAKIPPQAWPRPTKLRRIAGPVIVILIYLGAVAVPAALFWRNRPTIIANTGPALGRLAASMAESLPPGVWPQKEKPLLLSDDPFRLYALRWELEKQGRATNFVLVDTVGLAYPACHRFLHRDSPERWPRLPAEMRPYHLFEDQTVREILILLSARGPLYYLHPSFGSYFEYFYQAPSKLIYTLKAYPTNSISGLPMTAEAAQEQDAFWRGFKSRELDPLIGKVPPFESPEQAAKKPKKALPVETMEAGIARMHSRALNHFGVELQRAGDFKKAKDYFELALQLNDANASAFINRDYNQRFQAGKRESEKPSEGARQRLGAYGGSWSALLAIDGPIDEPSVCYLLAQTFGNSPNLRQAAQQLKRVTYFTPENLSARVALVSFCARIPLPDKALELAAAIRGLGARLTEEQELSLLEAEAWAHAYKNDIATTEKLLREAREKFPKQTTAWATQLEIYDRLGRIKEATDLLNQQLKSQPTNVIALVNYASLLIRAKQSSNAIPYLDRALQLNPKMEQALFNRALAYLESSRLDAALSDYRNLELMMNPPSHDVYYGLGEIYFRKKNRNKAEEYFEKYLKSAPRGLPERRLVEERLKTIENGAW
jgi:tetratricopeptide (TPR) repeat protein